MIRLAGQRRARRFAGAVLVLVAAGAAALPAGAQTPTAALAGHYYLKGEMEVGSELLLLPDGRFRWMMSYGAVDQQAQGRWIAHDGRVELDPEAGDGQPLLAVRTAGPWSSAASAALAAIQQQTDASPAFACAKGQKGIPDSSGADTGWGCTMPSPADRIGDATLIAVRLTSPAPVEMDGIPVAIEMADGSKMRAVSQNGWLFFPRPANAKVVRISVDGPGAAPLATLTPAPADAGAGIFDLVPNIAKLQALAELPTLKIDGHDLVVEDGKGRYIATQ